jgi:hypothetical protein
VPSLLGLPDALQSRAWCLTLDGPTVSGDMECEIGGVVAAKRGEEGADDGRS